MGVAPMELTGRGGSQSVNTLLPTSLHNNCYIDYTNYFSALSTFFGPFVYLNFSAIITQSISDHSAVELSTCSGGIHLLPIPSAIKLSFKSSSFIIVGEVQRVHVNCTQRDCFNLNQGNTELFISFATPNPVGSNFPIILHGQVSFSVARSRALL